MLRNDAKRLSSKRAEMQMLASEFQDRIRSGELSEEEDITSRLLERIGSTLTFSDGDLKVVTKAVTVGKQKEEPASGADIAVVSYYQSPKVVITKGFLAQAKNLNLQQKMYQPGWGRLQNQCKKMLERTNESFVWLYSGTSLRVHKANAVDCLKSQTVDDLPYMYLKTFLIDYLICHHGDPNISFRDLPRLQAIIEEQGVAFALLVLASSGPDSDPHKISPLQPDGGPTTLSKIVEKLGGEPIEKANQRRDRSFDTNVEGLLSEELRSTSKPNKKTKKEFASRETE